MYIKVGIDKVKKQAEKYYGDDFEHNIRILPIISDPTKADGDGDGIADGSELIDSAKYTDDEKPLKYSFKYYDDELQKIRLSYPNAEFVFFETDIDFIEFVNAQYNENNPVPKAEDYTKYGNEANPFVETNDDIIKRRGSNGIKLKDGNFYLSTYEGVEYYVNPKTYLDKMGIFAFYCMKSSKKSATLSTAKQLLRNTYFDQEEKIDSYAQAFVDASIESNMDLAYIVSKCIIEAGAGTKGHCSKLCSGVEVDGVMCYNMYGINANDGNATNSGAEYAFSQGWSSQEVAIIEGAKWINEKYVLKNQDTLYKQRFNIIEYINSGTISGQYASDISMAYTKGKEIYKKSYDMLKNEHLIFEIPIYNNCK